MCSRDDFSVLCITHDLRLLYKDGLLSAWSSNPSGLHGFPGIQLVRCAIRPKDALLDCLHWRDLLRTVLGVRCVADHQRHLQAAQIVPDPQGQLHHGIGDGLSGHHQHVPLHPRDYELSRPAMNTMILNFSLRTTIKISLAFAQSLRGF